MIAINVSMIGTFTIAITEKQTLKKAGLLYPFMIYEVNIICLHFYAKRKNKLVCYCVDKSISVLFISLAMRFLYQPPLNMNHK